jgi:hypothetical protein
MRWAAMFAFGLAAVGVAWLFGGLRSAIGSTDDLPFPTINSWAVRLLATTVGVIYVFTSIAKMDWEWCGGHTLRRVGTTADVLLPVERLAQSVGISSETFWAGLATFVIPLELALAVIYVVSARQDEDNRHWLRRICAFGWLLAIGLHLNNEMMSLIIQWFGYYMLLLASLLLLPARVLMVFGSMFYSIEAAIRDSFDKRLAQLSHGGATVVSGLLSMLAFVSLVGMGFFTGIMGAIVATLILSGLLVITLVYGLVAGWERKAIPLCASALVSSLLMTLAVAQCSMRFDYYDLRGKTLQQLGNNEAAIQEMELARNYPAPSSKAEAELFTNLALANRRLGGVDRLKAAERYYQEAIALDSRQFLAHYSLANLLISQQQIKPAEKHYRAAIRIKPDFSDAYVNLGNLLEFNEQYRDAMACYQTALEIEPNAADIKELVASAAQRLRDSGETSSDGDTSPIQAE